MDDRRVLFLFFPAPSSADLQAQFPVWSRRQEEMAKPTSGDTPAGTARPRSPIWLDGWRRPVRAIANIAWVVQAAGEHPALIDVLASALFYRRRPQPPAIRERPSSTKVLGPPP